LALHRKRSHATRPCAGPAKKRLVKGDWKGEGGSEGKWQGKRKTWITRGKHVVPYHPAAGVPNWREALSPRTRNPAEENDSNKEIQHINWWNPVLEKDKGGKRGKHENSRFTGTLGVTKEVPSGGGCTPGGRTI